MISVRKKEKTTALEGFDPYWGLNPHMEVKTKDWGGDNGIFFLYKYTEFSNNVSVNKQVRL